MVVICFSPGWQVGTVGILIRTYHVPFPILKPQLCAPFMQVIFAVQIGYRCMREQSPIVFQCMCCQSEPKSPMVQNRISSPSLFPFLARPALFAAYTKCLHFQTLLLWLIVLSPPLPLPTFFLFLSPNLSSSPDSFQFFLLASRCLLPLTPTQVIVLGSPLVFCLYSPFSLSHLDPTSSFTYSSLCNPASSCSVLPPPTTHPQRSCPTTSYTCLLATCPTQPPVLSYRCQLT